MELALKLQEVQLIKDSKMFEELDRQIERTMADLQKNISYGKDVMRHKPDTLVSEDIMEQVKAELTRRAGKLGRVFEPKEQDLPIVPTRFQFGKEEMSFDNPFLQAQYMYELIEGE